MNSTDDTLNGTAGNDDLRGFGGNDTLNGEAGVDILYGDFPDGSPTNGSFTSGADQLFGGAGNDFLSGGDLADSLYGGDGDDVLVGGRAADAARTPTGFSFRFGNTVPGSQFNNQLGDSTGDVLDGGAGSDLGYLSFISNADLSFDNSAVGTINQITSGGVVVGSVTGVERLVFFSGGGNDVVVGGEGIDNLSGGAGNDTLRGNGGADSLTGGAGNDVIEGGAGNDLLTGSDGDDLLQGGAGDDQLSGNGQNDVLDGGDGVDTVTYGDPATVDLRLQGTAQNTGRAGTDTLIGIENLTGSGNNDRFIGDAGNNILSGGAGDDRLDGGAGADRLLGGVGADILAGDDGDDELRGDGGDDRLDGGAGDDVAVYETAAASNGVGFLADGAVRVIDAGGRDALVGMERLRFTDGALDLAAAAPVGRTYATFAGRDATGAELVFWTGEIAAGRIDIAGVKATILADPAGQANTARVVGELYGEYLGRAPDAAELTFWDGQVRGGVEFAQVRSALVADPSGQAFAAARIASLYVEYIGRAAGEGEIAFWTNEVRLGTEFDGVRSVLLADGAGQANTAARVTALYDEFLGRTPAAGELSFWSGQIAAGTDFAGVRTALVDDPAGRAFIGAAIDAVYRDYGGRPATGDEVGFWTGQVRAGSGIDDVRGAVLDDGLGRGFTTSALSGLYTELFGRDASAGEQGVWSGLFRDGFTVDTARSTLTFDGGSTGRVDQLVGTAAADSFVFETGDRHLAVSGFDPLADFVDLRALGLKNFDLRDASQAREVRTLDGGADVLILLGDGRDVVLRGVALGQLGAEDFLL